MSRAGWPPPGRAYQGRRANRRVLRLAQGGWVSAAAKDKGAAFRRGPSVSVPTAKCAAGSTRRLLASQVFYKSPCNEPLARYPKAAASHTHARLGRQSPCKEPLGRPTASRLKQRRLGRSSEYKKDPCREPLGRHEPFLSRKQPSRTPAWSSKPKALVKSPSGVTDPLTRKQRCQPSRAL